MADRRVGASAAGARKGRGRKSLLISAAVVVAVIALIWTEQVALLYVLATLSVAALLVVVAFSDLGRARAVTQPAPGDDSAAAGDTM
ncbi:MAG TPA: hypothetical protein VIP46_21725, partial [Pyrinomonadaceae bacterium]